MSIDLLIEPVRPIRVTPLLPKIAVVLADMLGLSTPPALAMERLEEGRPLPVVTDQVGVDKGPLLLISIAGEPETVALLGGADHLGVTISGQRSSLLYALGAAIAIALARELGSRVWDDRKFFGHEVHTSPETLFEGLRVRGRHSDYRDAAENITWGPAGGS